MQPEQIILRIWRDMWDENTFGGHLFLELVEVASLQSSAKSEKGAINATSANKTLLLNRKSEDTHNIGIHIFGIYISLNTSLIFTIYDVWLCRNRMNEKHINPGFLRRAMGKPTTIWMSGRDLSAAAADWADSKQVKGLLRASQAEQCFNSCWAQMPQSLRPTCSLANCCE